LRISSRRGAHFQHPLRIRFGHRGQRLVQRIGHALQTARLLVATDCRVLADLLAHRIEVADGGGVVLSQSRGGVLARGLKAEQHFTPQFTLEVIERAAAACPQQRERLQRDHDEDGASQQIEMGVGHQSALLRIQSAVS
jgi:hypothetical protein